MRRRINSRAGLAGLALLALTAGGCSGGISNATDAFKSDAGWFSKPLNVFTREDGTAAVQTDKNFNLTPTGAVPPEDLVGPDGSCAPAVAEGTAQVASADRPVGSAAGDLAGPPMPAAADGSPSVLGGVALGMTECQAVRRAGMPSNVSIGVGDGNERKVVLTYLGGSWPGVYTFMSGRLKDISAAPTPPKPAPKARTRAAPRRS